ncbi:unnamed protein product [Rotaria sp. Silwood1]|nr:unnamed protein product [Rotaria sp. Silwood1]
MLVPCSSADIQCPWIGPRDEQANHIATCSFQQLRPIITSLQVELQKSTEIQNELRRELKKQSSRIYFLYAFINKGKLMCKKCKTSSKSCPYSLASRKKTGKKIFPCVVCEELVRKRDVSLHTCSSKSDCDCICRKCRNQYCSREDNRAGENEDDDEEDEEDNEDGENEDEEDSSDDDDN